MSEREEASAALERLLRERSVLLCVGSGGVGKTTTSASLALAAAMRGRRVLCLTIDPAKRLANSLGLASMTTEASLVAPQIFADAGLEVSGSLTVMMLDTKKTFDDIVRRHASSPAARDAILGNTIYQYVSTSLAGTQEYMAMEKLQAVRDGDEKPPPGAGDAYDLVVLDTPPTANALDFLDAPERMIEAIDSPAMRYFVQAFSNRGGLGFVGRTSQLVLKGVAAITGAQFLGQLAAFIATMNDLFGGFTARAKKVADVLRGPEVAFVLVTSPEPMAIDEINFFADRLAASGMRRDVFVVNRVHVAPEGPCDAPTIVAAVTDAALPNELGPAFERARHEAEALARRDEQHLARLHLATGGVRSPMVRVPAFDHDVHDVGALAEVAHALVGPPRSA